MKKQSMRKNNHFSRKYELLVMKNNDKRPISAKNCEVLVMENIEKRQKKPK